MSGTNVYQDTTAAGVGVEISGTPGTTPGTGKLAPSLFAREVALAGWPVSGPDTNKSIKVSGANLKSGSKLILHGFGYMAGGVGTDDVPYYIYTIPPASSHDVAPPVFATYTY